MSEGKLFHNRDNLLLMASVPNIVPDRGTRHFPFVEARVGKCEDRGANRKERQRGELV